MITHVRETGLATPATPAPPLADPAAARAWLDGERAALVLAAASTAGNGRPRHATRLAATLHHYIEAGPYDSDAVTIHASALAAARRIGDL